MKKFLASIFTVVALLASIATIVPASEIMQKTSLPSDLTISGTALDTTEWFQMTVSNDGKVYIPDSIVAVFQATQCVSGDSIKVAIALEVCSDIAHTYRQTHSAVSTALTDQPVVASTSVARYGRVTPKPYSPAIWGRLILDGDATNDTTTINNIELYYYGSTNPNARPR